MCPCKRIWACWTKNITFFLQPGGNARLAELLNAQRKQLGCRIYQLEFTDTEKTKPFAFSGIDALKAGFQQPPASEYRLVRDETIYCPKDEPDLAVLERVFDRYNGKLPADYPGRDCTVRCTGAVRCGKAAVLLSG